MGLVEPNSSARPRVSSAFVYRGGAGRRAIQCGCKAHMDRPAICGLDTSVCDRKVNSSDLVELAGIEPTQAPLAERPLYL